MSNPLQPGAIVRTRHWSTHAEQSAVITFHWQCAQASGQPVTDFDFAKAIDTIVAPALKAILPTDVTYKGTQAQIISNIPLTLAVPYNTAAGPGLTTAPALPTQTCGLISWYTNNAGRAYRGRTYMPFPAPGEETTGSVPTTAYLTSLSNLAAALMNTTSVANAAANGTIAVAQIILHKQKKGVLPTGALVQGFIIRPKWATQRRRGSFGRANVSPI